MRGRLGRWKPRVGILREIRIPCSKDVPMQPLVESFCHFTKVPPGDLALAGIVVTIRGRIDDLRGGRR